MTSHDLFDGRLQVYKRGEGRYWQCAARVGGQRYRESTKQESLALAKEIAEDWYLSLHGKMRRGELSDPPPSSRSVNYHSTKPKKHEPTFKQAYEEYLAEVKVLALSVRSPKYAQYMELRMNRHLLPYFGKDKVSAITSGKMQSYLVQRLAETTEKKGKPPARSTLLQEVVHVRQVLKYCERQGQIAFVPNLSSPFLKKTKKSRRAWFSPEEYQRLYEATRARITNGKRPGWEERYADTHDFVLFQGNSGLRPDETIGNLQIRDIEVIDEIIDGERTGKQILDIDVRGKTGVGYCKTMPGAVLPYKRAKARREAELRAQGHDNQAIARLLPSTPLFPKFNREVFNAVLDEEGLKYDRDGKPRTAYSLRHTYISMRLMDGANIVQVANNCRTSVQMIHEHYAAHIRELVDPSGLNTRRSKTARAASKQLRERRDMRKQTDQQSPGF
ncbi:site-specific integrase [Sphingobium sp. HBC34]|uniref:Site-specific integrase n=1 Tax=Sphingobium cyanobacteriorum TaxID=3063954 RepID=A0ABT8ZSB0_9SPHN|nr:site-specific integrase [Sphingobium sp. HBC34]MDO7837081.1 site-specific integrase [Sphingobium sp. HBC34]